MRETKRKGERGERERKREIRVDGERKREVRGWGGDRDAHVYLFFLLCNITMHDNNIIIQTKYSSVAMCVFVVLPSYWLFFLSCLVLSCLLACFTMGLRSNKQTTTAVPRNEDDVFQRSAMCAEVTQSPIPDLEILLQCGQEVPVGRDT